MPEVAADPQGEVAKTFQNLGISVVQQCAKIRQQGTLSLHGSLEKNVPKTVSKILPLFLHISPRL
jgi:hypothetical protein